MIGRRARNRESLTDIVGGDDSGDVEDYNEESYSLDMSPDAVIGRALDDTPNRAPVIPRYYTGSRSTPTTTAASARYGNTTGGRRGSTWRDATVTIGELAAAAGTGGGAVAAGGYLVFQNYLKNQIKLKEDEFKTKVEQLKKDHERELKDERRDFSQKIRDLTEDPKTVNELLDTKKELARIQHTNTVSEVKRDLEQKHKDKLDKKQRELEKTQRDLEDFQKEFQRYKETVANNPTAQKLEAEFIKIKGEYENKEAALQIQFDKAVADKCKANEQAKQQEYQIAYNSMQNQIRTLQNALIELNTYIGDLQQIQQELTSYIYNQFTGVAKGQNAVAIFETDALKYYTKRTESPATKIVSYLRFVTNSKKEDLKSILGSMYANNQNKLQALQTVKPNTLIPEDYVA